MSDPRSQGRKANDAGQSADATVREHLATHASLLCSDVKTLKEYESTPVGGLFRGRADFAEDVCVCDEGFLGSPFVAHYALRHRDWPHTVLLFVHSQTESGTAENAVARFLLNLALHKQRPGVILLIGDHWERAASPRKVGWLRDWARKRGSGLLRVFLGVAEFRTWIAEGMPWPEVKQQSFA